MRYNCIDTIPIIFRFEIIHMPRKLNLPNNINAIFAKLHSDGQTVQSIAAEYGICRQSVQSRIILAGGIIRGIKDAQKLRMSKTTPEYRQQITKAAHDAVRGTKYTEERHIKMASHGRIIGFGEFELADEFIKRGYAIEAQKPCGKYNIDIAIHSIAVEILAADASRIHEAKFP
jgi:hypothetical protein